MSIAFVVTSVANCCRPRSSPPPLALRVTDDRLLLDRLTAGRFVIRLARMGENLSTLGKAPKCLHPLNSTLLRGIEPMTSLGLSPKKGMVDETLDLFNELQLQHQVVATKAKTLHDACDRLLIKKQRLIEFAEALRSKLKYFDELENVLEKYKHVKNEYTACELAPTNTWAWQGREEGNEARREREFINSSTICLQWFLYCSLGENGSNPTMAAAIQPHNGSCNNCCGEKERERNINCK
ncbi:hypothetical protein CsSME_00004120 [Camellia sinensis var. sinensis]